MYHAACKVEFQPFKRLYSQLTFFNVSDVPRSWVSTIQTVVLTADVFQRVWCTTQLAKLSFNHSHGRTHSWRICFPPEVVFRSWVIGACPVTTDCIVAMSSWENNNNIAVSSTLHATILSYQMLLLCRPCGTYRPTTAVPWKGRKPDVAPTGIAAYRYVPG